MCFIHEIMFFIAYLYNSVNLIIAFSGFVITGVIYLVFGLGMVAVYLYFISMVILYYKSLGKMGNHARMEMQEEKK